MASAEIAIGITIQNEGGYTNNPNDAGGATKYGIEQRDVDLWLPDTNVQDLTVEQAQAYYQTVNAPGMEIPFWNKLYSEITNQEIANKLMDMGVLFGIGEAVKVMQIILNITADGNFGPESLAAVNAADPASLLKSFQTGLVTHALQIGAANVNDRGFVAGWVARINRVP